MPDILCLTLELLWGLNKNKCESPLKTINHSTNIRCRFYYPVLLPRQKSIVTAPELPRIQRDLIRLGYTSKLWLSKWTSWLLERPGHKANEGHQLLWALSSFIIWHMAKYPLNGIWHKSGIQCIFVEWLSS